MKGLVLGYSVLQKPSDDVCTQRCDGCQVHPSHFHKQDNVLFSEKPWNSLQMKHVDPFGNLVTQLVSPIPPLKLDFGATPTGPDETCCLEDDPIGSLSKTCSSPSSGGFISS